MFKDIAQTATIVSGLILIPAWLFAFQHSKVAIKMPPRSKVEAALKWA